MPYPKIELHVHFEGTVQPATLLEIARRNDVALPARDADELAALYRYRDFAHFVSVWVLTTQALRRADDFRQIVVDYARQAAAHGAVYLEGIFSPAEPVRRGSSWEEVFEGYCNGAQEARELHGVEVRLTPDITRSYDLDTAELVFDRRPPTETEASSAWASAGRRSSTRRHRSSASFVSRATAGSLRYPTRERSPASTRSGIRSSGCARTESATASARWTTPDWCASSPTGGQSSTSARFRTSASAPSARSRSIRSQTW